MARLVLTALLLFGLAALITLAPDTSFRPPPGRRVGVYGEEILSPQEEEMEYRTPRRPASSVRFPVCMQKVSRRDADQEALHVPQRSGGGSASADGGGGGSSVGTFSLSGSGWILVDATAHHRCR